ncbi:MAG: hypothetical protein LBH28_06050 [Oscillospiraceae bacterium]|nr:hypothetical protein [Oscillospiraceae bacterium]
MFVWQGVLAGYDDLETLRADRFILLASGEVSPMALIASATLASRSIVARDTLY